MCWQYVTHPVWRLTRGVIPCMGNHMYTRTIAFRRLHRHGVRREAERRDVRIPQLPGPEPADVRPAGRLLQRRLRGGVPGAQVRVPCSVSVILRGRVNLVPMLWDGLPNPSDILDDPASAQVDHCPGLSVCAAKSKVLRELRYHSDKDVSIGMEAVSTVSDCLT